MKIKLPSHPARLNGNKFFLTPRIRLNPMRIFLKIFLTFSLISAPLGSLFLEKSDAKNRPLGKNSGILRKISNKISNSPTAQTAKFCNEILLKFYPEFFHAGNKLK